MPMRGRGRGGTKAPVQPEDGSGLGIHRLKRVADFGPPTVGTLPVRNKKRKGRGGGPGRGGYGSAGDRNNGLPPRVGTVPRGGAGRGRGRGGGGQRSRGSSPRADKGKGRDEGRDGRRDDGNGAGPSRQPDYDQERESQQRRDRIQDSGYGRDGNGNYGRDTYLGRRDDEREEEYRNSRPRSSSPPRPLSPVHHRWDSSPREPIRFYSPSQPVFSILSETESDVTEVPRSQRGLPPAGAPHAGTQQRHLDAESGPSRSGPSTSHQLEPTAVDAPPPRPPPKFKPRNHNVRENLPVSQVPPPPPPKEPTPPPPEPPKFKPRNHNPRKNVPPPAPVPTPSINPPPERTVISPPVTASRIHHASPPPPPPQPEPVTAPKSIPTVPITTTLASSPQDVKPDPAALAIEVESSPPPASPPKEGVEWIKPEDIPSICMQHATAATREHRQNARKQFVTAQRKRLLKLGKVVVSSKWRGDGLAIDWRLSTHVPPDSDSDDDIIEVIPAPRKATPEAIVVDDTPSPPMPPIEVGPDFSISGAVLIEFPPRFSMPMGRKTEAFAEWREAQLEKFRTPTTTVEHSVVLKGLRVRWTPVVAPVATPAVAAEPTVAPPPSTQPTISVRRAASSGPAAATSTASQDKGKRRRTESTSPRKMARIVSPAMTLPSVAEVSSNFAVPTIPAFGALPTRVSESTASPGLLQPPPSLDAVLAAGSSGPGPQSAYTPIDFNSASGPSLAELSEFAMRTGAIPTSSAEWAPPPSGIPTAEGSEWIDSAAIERAVVEATSASRSRSGSRPLSGEPSSLGLYHAPPSADLGVPTNAASPAIPSLEAVLSPKADPAGTPQPLATAAERLASLERQLNVLFDRIDRWMRLQEDFPERAEQLQRQIERTELGIFELQNKMDVEKRAMEAETNA